MAFKFETPEDSTPLEPEELEQLIPVHITTMKQLNEAEQLNIAAASLWALGRGRSDVLSEKFTKAPHKQMFGDVWRWAGKYRTHGVNIGNVDAYEIGIRLNQLFGDAQHWMDNDVYKPDEIAARLHHGLNDRETETSAQSAKIMGRAARTAGIHQLNLPTVW